jgi:lysozyme family protein
LGYAKRGIPSPYIWASTDQYTRGKYVADGHFDPNAIDHQLGCAALINRMAAGDESVTFVQS